MYLHLVFVESRYLPFLVKAQTAKLGRILPRAFTGFVRSRKRGTTQFSVVLFGLAGALLKGFEGREHIGALQNRMQVLAHGHADVGYRQ